MNASSLVAPGTFEPEKHYYSRVLNAQLHPLVRFFMNLGNSRIASRYCHLWPQVDETVLREKLESSMRFFRWGGADLFPTTDAQGLRRHVIIETNSCPSGQKSTPYILEHVEEGGYRTLLERSFLPLLKRRNLPQGGLAVLYDKNPMETSGYAAVLANLTGENVHLVYFPEGSDNARFVDGVLEVKSEEGYVPIRAAFRYVTQRPWNRIPPITRTALLNPTLVCLAGGRNKMLAAKAYDLYNASLIESGLSIHTPETIWDVELEEVPLWVERMGGVAVLKVPYSNAGQGVYTITHPDELKAFMAQKHRYKRFIVQGLIGNASWSSRTRKGRFYHLGTLPNKKLQIFVADLRMMIGNSPEGFFPVAIYARRARKPLVRDLQPGESSWDMLGTNLSVKREDGGWDTQTERLLLMDSRDFNRLGLGIDDLVEAYVQTVLSVSAIDAMSCKLVTQKGRFRRRMFSSLNPDPVLVEEIAL